MLQQFNSRALLPSSGFSVLYMNPNWAFTEDIHVAELFEILTNTKRC